MPSHVALLRGINVGGRNKVAMADLRAVVTSLGHADVATYIQSGNVIFTPAGAAGEPDAAALAAGIEQAIAATLGVSPRVLVLSRDDLAQIVQDDPYPDEPDPRKVHAIMLSAAPGPEVAAAVADEVRRQAERGARDAAEVVGRTIYLHTPDGFGRSDLALRLTQPKAPGAPELTTTARNRATITKLLALLDG